MKSQFKAGKLFLVGTLVLLSAMFTKLGTVSADSGVVPNATVCAGGPTTKYVHGSGSFTVVWNHDNTFTITVTKALTHEIKLYASSYHLTSPDYKGGCFGTVGTSPQTWDQNTQTITLPCGWSGTKTVTVVLPDACYNEQVDLYFGNKYGQPLNGTVGSNGHNDYGWIAGNIMLTANNPACNTPTQPTQPTAPTTPTTPQVLGASTTKPAATLTDTGLPVAVTSSLAVVLMASAIVVSRKKAVQNFDDIAL